MHFDWSSVGAQLDVEGYAVTPTVLSDAQIRTFTALCDAASTTHRVPLAPRDLGRGDLIFAAQGFPSFVAALQTRGYKHLAPVAKRWNALLDISHRHPAPLNAVLDRDDRAASPHAVAPHRLAYAQG